jgi:hypothetical protein
MYVISILIGAMTILSAAHLYLQAIETLCGVHLCGEIILEDLLVAGFEEGKPSTCFTKNEQTHLGDWILSVVVVRSMVVARALFVKLEVLQKKKFAGRKWTPLMGNWDLWFGFSAVTWIM